MKLNTRQIVVFSNHIKQLADDQKEDIMWIQKQWKYKLWCEGKIYSLIFLRSVSLSDLKYCVIICSWILWWSNNRGEFTDQKFQQIFLEGTANFMLINMAIFSNLLLMHICTLPNNKNRTRLSNQNFDNVKNFELYLRSCSRLDFFS